MTFVDIKNDIAFRKIFGNENKKIILISFLNAVLHLEGTKRIKSITIANPFQLPILPNMKTSIIDVKATDFRGNTFIIEMQVADILGMDKRLLYYTSKEYSQQIVSGEKYTDLNPVIFIGIFDFNFTKGTDYFSHHAICNVKTQERLIKDMDFYFIELPKFLIAPKDLNNVVDKWIYFIKEAENLDVIPDNLDDEGLREAYLDANKNTWTKDELNAYDYAAMREQDERGRVEKARRDARQDTKHQLILEMYSEKIPVAQIAKISKLTIEEVMDIVEKD
jgi:predicted transposase/invertase (TIGR01784 family)